MFRPEIWSPRCTEAFYANLQAGKFFEDFSDLVENGGRSVNIPTVGTISVSAVGVNSGDTLASAITDTMIRLDITRWMHTGRRISDFNYAQMAKSYRLQKEMMNSQINSLASFFDRELLATGNSFTYHTGDTNDALGATNIESAIGILASLDVPLKECAFFFHPSSYWYNLSKVSKYYDASVYGKQRMPDQPYTEIQGIPVYLTTNVLGIAQTSGTYRVHLLAHKSAIAWAMGALPGATQNGVVISVKESEMLRKTIYTQIAYGVVLRRATGGVKILTR